MGNIILMNKPDDLWKRNQDYFRGDEIVARFFNQGIWKENHIPRELSNINWTPENDVYYKVWWEHTNPADPADPGIDIIFYVEQIR